MAHEPTSPHDPARAHRRDSGLAIAALVLGVLALATCWTIVGGVLLGLGAIIVGLIALTRIKQGRAGGHSMAVIGMAAGTIGVLVASVMIALGVSFLNSDSTQNLRDCLEQAGKDEAAQEQCQRDFAEEISGGAPANRR